MPAKRSKTQLPFAKILTQLLKEKGLTVRSAAKLCGVPVSVLMDWRSGSNPSDILACARLARVLNVSLSFLLTGEDETRSNKPPSLAEVLSEGPVILDGICQVTIRQLNVRNAPTLQTGKKTSKGKAD